MANLSQDYRTIIAERPLDNALDHLRDSLQKVEQIPSQVPSLSAAIDRNRNWDELDAGAGSGCRERRVDAMWKDEAQQEG